MTTRPTIRTTTLAQYKAEGKKFAMLTAYDYSTAAVFDAAEIPTLLVGDSAGNVIYGYSTTTQVSIEELIPLVRGVVRGAPHALVVADLPFGTYEVSPQQAVASAARMLRDTGAHAVKIEGGVRMRPQLEALRDAAIPVMGHIGFTPQSVNQLGGFKVQGRGEAAAACLADAQAVADAGAFAVVLEMVPAELAKQVTETVAIPTIGIGAGPDTDGQVLVWQDAVSLPAGGRRPRFVREFAPLGQQLQDAAVAYREAVAEGSFPAAEHTF